MNTAPLLADVARLPDRTGIAFGVAVAVAIALMQPFNVCDTVYVPATGTVIDGVVAPLLHNRLPVYPEADKMELPQLLTTDTCGASGIVFGEAIPAPALLVHPLIVCVTVYDPAVVTVVDAVVAPLFHNSEPVKLEAVNTELPQLFVTCTVGTEGMVLGDAMAVAGAPVHPFAFCVTVYVPPVVTVISALVNPLLQSSEPFVEAAVSVELPQLLMTVTIGAGKVLLTGIACAVAAALEHPFTV